MTPSRPPRKFVLSLENLRNYGRRFSLYALLAVGVLLAGHWASGAATTLIWDASTANPNDGPQDGMGNWTSTDANWWNGTGDQQWANSTAAQPVIAQFGANTAATNRTVTLNDTFQVNGLVFAALPGTLSATNPAYTLTGGTIALDDNGTITLNDKASISGSFVMINSALTGANITIQRGTGTSEQFLQLSGANNLTGTLTLAGGSAPLFVRASNSGTLNSVTTIVVNANDTLNLQGEGSTYTSNFILAGIGGTPTDRGAIRFENDMTLTGTITLAGDTMLNFQSSTPTASDVTFTQGIGEQGGSFSFTKTGLGTLTMQGPSTYTGSTTIAPSGSGVDPGTLLLDFTNTTTTANLLYNGVTPGTEGKLVLGGNSNRTSAASTGTLQVLGADFFDNTQSFGGLSVTGPAAIQAYSGLGGTVSISLGAITRSGVGTTLSITAPDDGAISTTTNKGTLLGTWASYTDPNSVTTWAGVAADGTIGGFTGDLAYVSSTNISALPGYAPASNLTVSAASSGAVTQGPGATTINTITMTDASADRTVTVGAGNTLNVGTTGGIQLTVGSRNLTIGEPSNAGTITAGTAAGAELFLSNYDSLNVLTVNSVIANNAAGTVNVVLNGGGTTVLTGANTYTGSTIVSDGILKITSNTALGAGTANTIVANGAELQLSGGLTINEAMTISGMGAAPNDGVLHVLDGANTSNGLITIGTAGTLITADAGSSLTLFRTSPTTTVVSGSNSIAFGGSGTITVNSVVNLNVNGAAAGISKSGNGTLILNTANVYTGSTSITGGVVRIGNSTGLGTIASGTTVSSGAALELTGNITVGAEALNLNGTGVNNGGALRNDSGTNTWGGTITLQSATRINSDADTLTISGAQITGTFALTFGGAGNITVNAPINTGTQSLTKDGAGTLTLAGADTFTGSTTINGGTMALGANNELSDTGGLTINNGTLALGTFTDTVAGVTLRNGAITGTTGVLTGSSFSLQNGTVSAGLAGTSATVGLSKSTSGTVILSGTNTLAGTITDSAGRLVLDYSGGATILPSADAIALAGGTLEVMSGSSPAPVTLGAVSTTANTGMSTLAVDANTAVTAQSLTRNSGSALFLDLSGAGSSLSFTTGPVVTNGVITAGGGNAAVTMEDSNGRYDFAALGAGNSIQRLNATTALVATGGTSGTNYLLTANNTPFSLTGNVAASTLRIDTTGAGGTLDLAGKTLTLGLFGVLNDGSNDFTIANSGTGGGLVGTSAVFVYQFGTGKLTLGATINSPQAFFMGNGLIDWTSASGGNSATHVYGATLRLSGAGITLDNSVTSGNGTGVLNIGNNGILELNTGPFLRAVGGSANQVHFIADGGGFSAYGADRVVNLGGAGATLKFGSTSGFLASGNKLILGSPYANATVDFQNGLDLNGATQTIEVQSPNVTGFGGMVSGNIVGAGGNLAKTGQGILNLAGANTYTGTTAVNAGTMLVTGSINGTSAVTVASGAELKLSGTGNIAAGTLSLSDSSKLSLEVGTLTTAPISLTGNTSLSGDITLALTLTTAPADGTVYTLIDGSSPLEGYDDGARFMADGTVLDDGSFFTVNTGDLSERFQISYQGGADGNDVTVQAIQNVPEPSTGAVLLASLGMLIGVNRFRRRSLRR